MAPIKITVLGTSSVHRHPERAYLTVRVSSNGPSQETVSNETTDRANGIQQLLKGLAPKTDTGEPASNASVTVFSVGFLRSWSFIPHDRKDKPRPREYHAELTINASFRDFKILGEVAAQLLGLSNVDISRIDWQLTAPTRKELEAESHRLAMLNAVEKANNYAQVIGREVVAVDVKEQGITGHEGYSGYGPPGRMMMMQQMQHMPQMPGASTGGRTERGLDLTPQNIEVSHSLQVKFRGK